MIRYIRIYVYDEEKSVRMRGINSDNFELFDTVC